ncbi:MAG: hypothetical protein ACPGJF_05685 [Sinimarinibacterium flocculans]|uniref:hypothetical protein n=1 Tax=Sinimarinibacterium flocculans TaxID=985250 RepID=UPI003C57BBAA
MSAGVAVINAPWCRIFDGDRDALIAAGLIRAEWLPGQPGRGRFRQTLFIDGNGRVDYRDSTRGGGASTEYEAGGRTWVRIERKSKRRYGVWRSYMDCEQMIRRQAIEQREIDASLYLDRDQIGVHCADHRRFADTAAEVMRAAFDHARMQAA